jgi:hypothetical protein
MKKALLILAYTCLLYGCGQKGKTVIVMTSGEVSLAGTTLTVKPGNTHTEQTQKYASGVNSIDIKDFPAATSASIGETGLYVLNLKNDTLVGSLQNFAVGEGASKISQDELKKKVDSLQSLVVGQNATAANHNFFIPPGKAQLISNNMEAQVYGPYVKTPSTVSGNAEVYKFYTNKQVRETIEKLTKMMTSE